MNHLSNRIRTNQFRKKKSREKSLVVHIKKKEKKKFNIAVKKIKRLFIIKYLPRCPQLTKLNRFYIKNEPI